MTRDLDLIRKLLIFFDEKPDAEMVQVPPIEGYDEGTILYHLVLMYGAGFLDCEPVKSKSGDRVVYVLPFDLTWDGHEFLARARNEFIWQEVMKDIKDRGLKATSIGLLKRLLDREVRKRLDL